MNNNSTKVVNIASKNLPEMTSNQGSPETHKPDELVQEQADTFVAAEVHEPLMNNLSKGREAILNKYNRSLIKTTMREYSFEDVFLPKNRENYFSQFNNHNEIGNLLGSTNIIKVLDYIGSNENKEKLETNEQQTRSVTWGAVFKHSRTVENLVRFSGLTAIKLVHLSPIRFKALWSALRYDPYSCLLINELDQDLTIIVKISATSTDEYAVEYQRLIDYYSQYHGITNHEFHSTNANICRLHDLKTGSKVYINLSSRRLSQLPYGLLKQSIENKYAVTPAIQPIYINTTPIEQLNQLEEKANSAETHLSINNTLTDSITALLQTEQRIIKAASQPIVFKPALVSRQGVPIIRNGTINVIQGKQGQHKSRLAELFASLLIAKDDCTTNFLGFERLLPAVAVCYIDTERNVDEEFAHAIQSIRRNAGYDAFNEEATNLRFTSLKQEARSERIDKLDDFLHDIRQSTDLPLFVVLDVVTDCVGSFNHDRDAMKLFDSLHQLCELHQATFLLVIHENPHGDKARGHVGTEATNKASLVLQINVENSLGKEPLIKLTYRKLRNDKQPDPLCLQLDNQTKQLQLADPELVKANAANSKTKINAEELVETVLQQLSEGALPKGELVEVIKNRFNAGDSNVRQTLKRFITNQTEMVGQDGQVVILVSSPNNLDYLLQPID